MTPKGTRHPEERSGTARWVIAALLGVGVCVAAMGALALFAFYMQVDRSLPSIESLRNYRPPLVSSIYASDGSLVGEFSTERRYLIQLKDVSPLTVKAFLAAEDARFYEHAGVDPVGIARAFFKNLQAGEIVQGGSTITQQVVKSLLLTPERTVIRKIKEAILAYRIGASLSKDEILSLYFSQIYLGAGAYGIEAAAQTYFGKHAKDLTLSESALLAGLPKAPSRFAPFQHFEQARERQKYVLSRMAEVGFIGQEEARAAYEEPVQLVKPRRIALNAFVEEVRRDLEARYGRQGLYQEGLRVYITMDPKAQALAEKSLDRGLRELDKRHGWRGPTEHLPPEKWAERLKSLALADGEPAPGKFCEGVVTGVNPKTRVIEVALGVGTADLAPAGYKWIGGKKDPLRPGDVIPVLVEKPLGAGRWAVSLEQEPEVEGAFLSLVPQTGRVIAMAGGRNFSESQFNRATQAVRQPGSSFKPFVYTAAIEKGYTPASLIVDSPFIKEDPSLHGAWKPSNYDEQFWGPIMLRTALVNSRNVPTIKLLEAVGVETVIEYARRMGIKSPLTPTLSLGLGASGVTLWELLRAYTAFPGQGERAEPYLIEKILDRNGRVLEAHQTQRESVLSPQTAYIMTSMLQGVIEEGTGGRARAIGRPAAGKTGTTNEIKDAWFVGFTPSLLSGAWVGYDDHQKSLGRGESGGRAAIPIWVSFMKEWLQGQPVETFQAPPGIIFARVNAQTGALAKAGDAKVVTCPFLEGNGPPEESQLATESGASGSNAFFKTDLF